MWTYLLQLLPLGEEKNGRRLARCCINLASLQQGAKFRTSGWTQMIFKDLRALYNKMQGEQIILSVRLVADPILSGFTLICAAQPWGNNALINVILGWDPPQRPFSQEKLPVCQTNILKKKQSSKYCNLHPPLEAGGGGGNELTKRENIF